MPGTNGPAADAVRWAIAKWVIAFPASFPDTTMTRARELALRELLAAHPWVTAPVLERAVYLVRWKHEEKFLPPEAVLVDYFQAAADELEREARARHRQLPPPAPPTDDERRAAEDKVEAAKLKARMTLPEKLRRKYTPPKEDRR